MVPRSSVPAKLGTDRDYAIDLVVAFSGGIYPCCADLYGGPETGCLASVYSCVCPVIATGNCAEASSPPT